MTWTFDECEVDLDRFELRRCGEPVAIEPQTMKLLIELLEHHGKVVTKIELLHSIWGGDFVSESALTTQVKVLRRLIGDTGRDQRLIRTVQGRGYMFVAPLEAEAEETREAAPESPKPLVAVLPFHNLSPEPEQAHVAEGITHDIVTLLSKHRWLRVLPRPTASAYAGASDPMTELHRDHGVGYVVEGSVRRAGDRLRVTVSLTDAARGEYVWIENYDRTIGDLFAVQDEITSVIVANLEPEVGYAERQRVVTRPPADLRAWDLFHLGLTQFFKFTLIGNQEAQRLLNESRELDPSFADAHAWWAYATVLGMVYWGTDPEPAVLDEALVAAETALRLDPHNAVFHMLRGRVQLARREYSSAMLDNQHAVELNPTFSAGYCGLGDSLCYEGRYDEAMTQFSKSVELGAHDPQLWAFLSYGALALLFAERFHEAIEWAERASNIPNCQYWTTAHLAVAFGHVGDQLRAERAVARLLDQCPQFTVEFARRKLFYLKRPEQLELYIEGLRRAGVPES